MLIRKLALQNVRSFLGRQEVSFDNLISIIIGPNGGGKTNLLDTLVIALRRYLLETKYPEPVNYGDGRVLWRLQRNNLQNMVLEKHSQGRNVDQILEISVELVKSDIENMYRIRNEANMLRKEINRTFEEDPWAATKSWNLSSFAPGDVFTYEWHNGSMVGSLGEKAATFLQYLQIFEINNTFRSEIGKEPLRLPMLYLPVNRSANGFTSNIGLSGFDDLDQRRTTDATTSKTGSNVIHLAVGRIASKYRLLQEESNVDAREKLHEDPNMQELTKALSALGYSWDLETTNPLTNEYTIRLTKQGSTFLVESASSGEKELLTYLFAIYALNVRGALIIVDEPELHLHPRWQSTLYGLFEKLAADTGNQFVFATHSPSFISPSSIQYVSRVYSKNQKSETLRLNSSHLPNAKHLFNVVNSQNNERIFFTDNVLMVEGLHDRIFFEKLLDEVHSITRKSGRRNLEIISVGGKGLFSAYSKLLSACQVNFYTISDLDYIEQVGSEDIKSLFKISASEIKRDVIDNIKSIDGETLFKNIEEAMISGSWGDAQSTWEYIKSKRRELRTDLNESEEIMLTNFIEEKYNDRLFILTRGTLESYLPKGLRGKDTAKLIEFVSAGDLLHRVPEETREELLLIANSILRECEQ